MCCMKREDLQGKKFGRWTVISFVEGSDPSKWICKCDCGKTKEVLASNLKRGLTLSCGCGKGEAIKDKVTVHGQSNSRLYRIWLNMRKRCSYTKNDNFKRYGAKGIRVCEEWKNDFEAFLLWSKSNGYSEGLSLDRINNDLGYAPNNCRWVSVKEQQNNRKDNVLILYKGKKQTLSKWADELGIKRTTLWLRIFQFKWTVETAFTVKTGDRSGRKEKQDCHKSLESQGIFGGRYDRQSGNSSP